MAKEKPENKEQQKPRTIRLWEWIVAAAGMTVVLGAIGVSVFRAFTEESTPPSLVVRVDSISPTQGGFLVRFSVINTGNQTAAGLQIEGELRDASTVVESSSMTLTYAPANSSREGGLFFTRNPEELNLSIRPTGYSVP